MNRTTAPDRTPPPEPTGPAWLMRMSPERAVLVVTGIAVATTLGALAGKSWCGIPGGAHDLYLRWCYSDIPPLFFSEELHIGAVPYLDHAVEYPVLTGLWMWLANLPANTAAAFLGWTAPLLVVSSGVTAWLLARQFGPARALYFAAAPTLLMSGAVNWDLPAVALMTAGLVSHVRGRDGWAGMWLGLGTAAKLFPGLLVLPLMLAAWRLRGRPSGLRTGLAAFGTWVFVNAPVAIAAPVAWGEFLRLSRERPSDWDAIWTVAAHYTPFQMSTPTLNLFTLVVFVVFASQIARVARRWSPPELWYLTAAPILGVFLLSSKVYSPQFSLWLLPLFVIAWPGARWWWAFVLADIAVTATRFPYLGNFVDDGLPGSFPAWSFHLAVVIRAVVLLFACGYAFRYEIERRHLASEPRLVEAAA